MIIDKSKSVYIQIADEIKRKVIARELSSGDLLPPVRVQAKEYNVTPKTIQNAMSLLEEQRIVNKVQGSGIYISISKKELSEMIEEEAILLMKQYIDGMNNLGFDLKEAKRKLLEVSDD